MRIIVLTPPEPVVTWEEASAHLRLDGENDEEIFVESLIAAATAHIDGPDGWLGRAIGQQQLEIYLPAPVADEAFHLPFPPVIEVQEISARTDSGWALVEPDIYDVRGPDVQLRPSANWPAWLNDSEAARVTYMAGYETVPPQIKAAILLMVGDLYRFRGTASDMNITATSIPMATTVQALLAPFRVFR